MIKIFSSKYEQELEEMRAALFARELANSYMLYAKEAGFSLEVMDENSADVGGIKEMIMRITGTGAYSRFKFEGGTHRVQRIPETEGKGASAHLNDYGCCTSWDGSYRCRDPRGGSRNICIEIEWSRRTGGQQDKFCHTNGTYSNRYGRWMSGWTVYAPKQE
jgi:hypothetical protein